jgi:hypothetical protein
MRLNNVVGGLQRVGDRLLDEHVGDLEAGDCVLGMVDRRRADERYLSSVNTGRVSTRLDIGEAIGASSQPA